LNKYSGLRSAAAEGKWPQRTMVPLSKLLKNGKLVQGTVVSVDPKSKTVVLEDGQKLSWDVLCIASGSRNFSPGEPPVNVNTKAGTEAYYKSMHAALAATKNVVIVGTGPVGIEMAGEIIAYGQKGVKITLVSKSSQILDAPNPLSKGNISSVTQMLAKAKVEVILKDEVVSETFPEDLSVASPLVQTPNGVKLRSGKHIPCDLLVYAVGSKVVTNFLPSEWLDPISHEILVDDQTLRVKGLYDVFGMGDAVKIPFTKMGYTGAEDAKVVAANVIEVVQGKAPTHKIKRMGAMMLIPFGPKQGRVLLPFGTMGNWSASKAKGKGLFTNMVWGTFAPGLHAPPA